MTSEVIKGYNKVILKFHKHLFLDRQYIFCLTPNLLKTFPESQYYEDSFSLSLFLSSSLPLFLSCFIILLLRVGVAGPMRVADVGDPPPPHFLLWRREGMDMLKWLIGQVQILHFCNIAIAILDSIAPPLVIALPTLR